MKADEITWKLVAVFACEDGGTNLVRFRAGLNQLETQAKQGDVDALQLLRIASQFEGIVDALIEDRG